MNSSYLLPLLVFLAITVLFNGANAALVAEEQAALSNFYSGLISTGSLSWNTSVDLCLQVGVICNGQNHVNSLALGHLNLVGTISTELGLLTALTQLSLRNNQLSGTVPTEFLNLSSLAYLYLDSNYLTGSFPALNTLPSITDLSLTNNYFCPGIDYSNVASNDFAITVFCVACSYNPCLNGATCNPTITNPLYTCTCPEGYTGPQCQQPITCSADTSGLFGNATWPTTVAGASASGTCLIDYKGSPVRPCLLNGTQAYWGPVTTGCLAIYCASDSSTGNATWPQTQAGKTIVGSCKIGYIGSPNRTCILGGVYGVWGSVTGNICQPIYCSDRTYANATWPSVQAGTTAVGNCSTGFYGTPKAQCLNNATQAYWNLTVSSACKGNVPEVNQAAVGFGITAAFVVFVITTLALLLYLERRKKQKQKDEENAQLTPK